MTHEDHSSMTSRLRAELAIAVAAANDREQQLRDELHERFVETAELTRQLLAAQDRIEAAEERAKAAEKRARAAERKLTRVRERYADARQRLREQEEPARRSLVARVRGRLGLLAGAQRGEA